MSERDLAEAIYDAIASDASINTALALWSELADIPDRDVLETVICAVASEAMRQVFARRQREAARTGPWDASSGAAKDQQADNNRATTDSEEEPEDAAWIDHHSTLAARRDERERCARAIEAVAVALRDNGPKTPEGLLAAIAGAQVGCLLDAAAALRAPDLPR